MSDIKITITGFKTIKEAKEWVYSYIGNVEQDMGTCAEVSEISHPSGYGFPFNADVQSIKYEEDNILLPLVHPDTYIKIN